VLEQNVPAKSSNNFKLPILLPIVNITMALAIVTERDFVGEGVSQSRGCEAAQGECDAV
jgi:hypothetical protein